MTRVVLAAHGTRDPGGARVMELLARAVRERLPGTTVDLGWLSVLEPELARVLSDAPTDIVVPVLLSSGYHVLVDIPELVHAGSGATVTPHLGPHRHVVRALADRIHEVDAEPVAVVLAAAGTSHPVGRSEARQAADMLSGVLGVPVGVAYASGEGPDVPSAVATFMDAGVARVTVAPYLLAPGMFADRVRTAASAAGARCAEVLADHPAIIDLVVERVLGAAARSGGSDSAPRRESAA
ncbi:Sirohydrochlorin ferrochelatase [Raineyella antarctica]|uniref:Sirohydrochlorin ferrochelatase n=1 Tax=Raineyella antarctica TaxID=1577474 RepID=A0A1G6GPG5_9ACTN|nr:sirohydrochlorin chelatase [Raineyella antarctica]SDB83086.1 Sirohydrochlorin ferrochelatase [Raineyella antarctica]